MKKRYEHCHLSGPIIILLWTLSTQSIFAFSELSHGPDKSTVQPSMQCQGSRPLTQLPHLARASIAAIIVLVWKVLK